MSHAQVSGVKEECHMYVKVYVQVCFSKCHLVLLQHPMSSEHDKWDVVQDTYLQDGCPPPAPEAQHLWWQSIVQGEEGRVEVRRRWHVILYRYCGLLMMGDEKGCA